MQPPPLWRPSPGNRPASGVRTQPRARVWLPGPGFSRRASGLLAASSPVPDNAGGRRYLAEYRELLRLLDDGNQRLRIPGDLAILPPLFDRVHHFGEQLAAPFAEALDPLARLPSQLYDYRRCSGVDDIGW